MAAVLHSNLTTHSAPFALPSGSHQVFVTGFVADGADLPSLQKLVGGAWLNLDPPVKFNRLEIGGGVKMAKVASGQHRWSVPTAGPAQHNINTNITQIG
jgi:hypothetical protein